MAVKWRDGQILLVRRSAPAVWKNSSLVMPDWCILNELKNLTLLKTRDSSLRSAWPWVAEPHFAWAAPLS